MRRWIAVVLLTLPLAVSACGDATPLAKTGEPAPPIVGETLQGEPFDLSGLRGSPVVVNFWGSWCVPCREEFPLLAAKAAELGPSDGLRIVGVLYKDDPAAALAFEESFGATWPSLPDPNGRIAEAYRVVAPPQTYFIDADGVLRGIHIGQILEEDFATLYPRIAPSGS